MTCIAALVDNDKIHMAADSEASDDASCITLATPKIAVNGDYIIGVSQSLRVLNILHNTALPPVPSRSNLYSFMCVEFVQSLAETLDNFPGLATREKMEEGTEIIVGTLGRLFLIASDYSIHESTHPYLAIGSGSLAAFGSLFSTEDLSPKARVVTAVKASAEFTTGVRGPINHVKFEQPS
jgi:ATP-dependent protease HslVU (ClpYQ) peptidase subunit